jgi:hypothetical protein
MAYSSWAIFSCGIQGIFSWKSHHQLTCHKSKIKARSSLVRAVQLHHRSRSLAQPWRTNYAHHLQFCTYLFYPYFNLHSLCAFVCLVYMPVAPCIYAGVICCCWSSSIGCAPRHQPVSLPVCSSPSMLVDPFLPFPKDIRRLPTRYHEGRLSFGLRRLRFKDSIFPPCWWASHDYGTGWMPAPHIIS